MGSGTGSYENQVPKKSRGISGLVAEYIVAIDVTRARFPADAHCWSQWGSECRPDGEGGKARADECWKWEAADWLTAQKTLWPSG